ncbi:MAG TPA: NAD-dependent epimerase/dehydratase family protein [Rhodospirillales bacterium]|nr:NAD-dependent epimerase/dehydratase family protein [Rhodospirillales bacterium]
MKILVTGGAGFIGSYVVRAYLAEGHEVVVVDDLSTGRLDKVPSGVRLHRLDLCDRESLAELFARERPEVVNHHAAQTVVPVSVENPRRDAEVNILGTLAVLECAVRNGASKFIFASSGGALYGEARELPTPEHYPAEPLSPYGIGKLAGELYVRRLAALHGMDHAILRYANVYGPGQDTLGEAGVVAIFARQMKTGLPPVIHGDGRQTRDFVFVGDVARANVLALEARDLVVNIGTGTETTVSELAQKIAEITGYEGPIRSAPGRPGDVRHSALDITRAKRELGWWPEMSLEEGLRRTVAEM